MKNSYNIWIPSVQKFYRFNELTIQHSMILYKASAVSDNEFLYAMMEILRELITDKTFSIDNLTIIDKYVIFIYLTMICANTTIKYNLNCSKCGEESTHTLNLNNLIVPLKDVIDMDYRQTISSPPYVFHCNVPSLYKEKAISEWYTEKDISQNDSSNALINFNIQSIMYIDDIDLDGVSIGYNKMSIDEQLLVLKNISLYHISKVETQFVNQIVKLITKTPAFNTACSKENCDYVINTKMDSVNEILRFVLVSSPETYFSEIAYFSKNHNVSPEFTIQQTTSDLRIFYELVTKAQEPPKSPHPEFDTIQ